MLGQLLEMRHEMGRIAEIIGVAVVAEPGGEELPVVGEQYVKRGPAQADYPSPWQGAQYRWHEKYVEWHLVDEVFGIARKGRRTFEIAIADFGDI